eukprot:753370-Hanusia_phi.AAC.13
MSPSLPWNSNNTSLTQTIAHRNTYQPDEQANITTIFTQNLHAGVDKGSEPLSTRAQSIGTIPKFEFQAIVNPSEHMSAYTELTEENSRAFSLQAESLQSHCILRWHQECHTSTSLKCAVISHVTML